MLASGTLAPVTALQRQLLPVAASNVLRYFSCGHVVPANRLLALAVGAGPSGAALDFRHTARAVPAAMDELGRLLSNICQIVPQVWSYPLYTFWLAAQWQFATGCYVGDHHLAGYV